jgi:hypothetical protein
LVLHFLGAILIRHVDPVKGKKGALGVANANFYWDSLDWILFAGIRVRQVIESKMIISAWHVFCARCLLHILARLERHEAGENETF